MQGSTTTKVTWSELRVGLLVIVSFSILVVAIFFIGQRTSTWFFGEKVQIYTILPKVSGLKEKAPVRLSGIDVGNVQKIGFVTIAEENKAQIEIVMEMDAQYRDNIRKDSIARISTIGLLGDKYVEITPGSLDEPLTTVNEKGMIEVEGAAPIDYEEVLTTASDAVDDLVETLKSAKSIVKNIDEGFPKFYRNLVSISESVSNVLRETREEKGTISKLIQDPQLYNNLVDVTREINTMTANINRGQGTLGKLATDPQLYDEIRSFSAKADSILVKLERGEGTAGRLMNDEELYERMTSLFIESQRLIEDIRKNPKKYINIQVF